MLVFRVVKDSSGALVSGDLVTLTSRTTNQSQVTASNEGFYRFSALSPGEYTSRQKRLVLDQRR